MARKIYLIGVVALLVLAYQFPLSQVDEPSQPDRVVSSKPLKTNLLLESDIFPVRIFLSNLPIFQRSAILTMQPTPHLRLQLANGEQVNFLYWRSNLWERLTKRFSFRFRIQPAELEEELDRADFFSRAQLRSYREQKDASGRTLLSIAAERGDARAVFELIALGAELEAADVDGCTALGWAAKEGQTICASLLMAAGADPDNGGSISARRLSVEFNRNELNQRFNQLRARQSRSKVLATLLLGLCWFLPYLPVFSSFNRTELIAYRIVLAAHQLVVVITHSDGRITAGDGDAIRFHLATVTSIGEGAYQGVLPVFLSLFYSTFGRSYLLGMSLSATAFALALMLYLLISHRLKAKRADISVLAIGLIPPSLVYHSLILREPYALVLILLSVLLFIDYNQNKRRVYLFGWFLSLGFLGLLHRAFLIWIPIWLVLSLRRVSWSRYRIPIILFGISVVALGLFTRYELENGTGQVQQMAAAIREGSISRDGRTTYPSYFKFDSLGSLIVSLPAVFGGYMLHPLPWEVSTKADLYAFLENVLRIALLVLAAWSYRLRRAELDSSIYAFLLLGYLTLEFTWSLGTQNWGTALRHHALGLPILLLAAQPELDAVFERHLSSG